MSNSQDTTCLIHVDVDGTPLPPHPGHRWTRFVCISDTHSGTYRIPPGDVLLHSGDLSTGGMPSDLISSVEWLKSLDHPVKIFVAGNHDLCLDPKWGEPGGKLDPKVIEAARAYVRSQSSSGLHYLEHETFRFTSRTGRTWKVYGSPSSPFFNRGAFQYENDSAEAQALYNRIPDDTEILITHAPPYQMLDRDQRTNKAVGCPTLAARLNNLKDCRLHVFGHVHEAAGWHVGEARSTGSRRASVNAAIKASQSAIVVDLLN